MNTEELIGAAEKAGCDVSAMDGREYQTMWCDLEQLQRLAATIENRTLERAAAMCETYEDRLDGLRDSEYQAELSGRQAGAMRCAAAIRQLKDK